MQTPILSAIIDVCFVPRLYLVIPRAISLLHSCTTHISVPGSYWQSPLMSMKRNNSFQKRCSIYRNATYSRLFGAVSNPQISVLHHNLNPRLRAHTLQIPHKKKYIFQRIRHAKIVHLKWNKRMMIRVGFEPTRFLTSKLISGEPETSAITTRPSDQIVIVLSGSVVLDPTTTW